MPIKVITPGLLTTVQDLGRPGFYHLGIPMSGAMDRYAFRAANLLVGNEENAAGLEAAFSGPELLFTERCVVAVTGAELPPLVDGQPRPLWAAFTIEAGQTLSFDFLKSAARACIAVSGGIDVPVVFGSRSTYLLGRIGGIEGRRLKADDVLPVGAQPKQAAIDRELPVPLRNPVSGAVTELRMIPGLYDHRLSESSKRNFYEDPWKLTSEADRTGIRLKGGRAMEFVEREQPFGAGSDPSNVVDCGYPYGSVQIPGGAQPIILHRDAVSAGGYFMLGTVISADMDRLSQLQPNQQIRFVQVNMEEALEARAAESKRLERLRSAFER